ncbi:MAG: hypothetical protein HZB31_01175 [Nitrospirae bacterium]|nr:hypothetical protein [Nitrospirota bacterium]
MNRKITGLLVFVFLTAWSAAAIAEPFDDRDRPPSKEQMEKVRKKIETMRMWKLTSALDLNEKISAQVFPVLNSCDRKRAEAETGVREGMRELRAAVKEKNEAKMKAALDRLEQNHTALQRTNDEERAELRNILSLEQQAKYVLFQQEFNREIRELIDEARERRGDGPGSRDQRFSPRTADERNGPIRPQPGR